MPDLNEFLYRPEIIHKVELEKIPGVKPCYKCDKDAEEALWDPVSLTLYWTCPDNHKNEFKVG